MPEDVCVPGILLFCAAVVVSLAASWLLVSRLERLGERAGFSEAWLGLVAALAADAPEITSAVTALARGQASVGAGVIIGSNVFNLAALLGLAAVVAGWIGFHRRVVVLSGVPAVWVAAVCLLTVAAVIAPAAGLALAAVVLAPYVAVLGMRRARMERLRLPARWRQWLMASDWVMRIAGDHVHRTYLIWRSGIMNQAPGLIDHTVVAMDLTDDAVLTIVMRDVGEFLVPPGNATVPTAQHARFIAHMAALSSAFWNWEDRLGLTTMAQRMRFFAPDNIAAELAAAVVPGPLAAAAAGWTALAERSPLLSAIARSVHHDPAILTSRLSGLPGTFLHGDWR